MLENLVMAEEMAAQGARVRPSYTERLSFVVGTGRHCATRCWIVPVPKRGAICRQPSAAKETGKN